MTPPLYIALRFLTHRKRALLLSLSGVVFGVAIFICTAGADPGLRTLFYRLNHRQQWRAGHQIAFSAALRTAHGFRERL